MAEASATAEVFRRVIVEPAYKAVSAEIDRAILGGALPLGAALPTEQELAERFGVHRSTVREAIRQVEQEGLLQHRESRRLFVGLPGVSDLTPGATRLLMLQQTTFHELWELAVTLEPLAARLAAQRVQRQDLQALQDNLAASRQCGDDAAMVLLDVQFHALVGRPPARGRALPGVQGRGGHRGRHLGAGGDPVREGCGHLLGAPVPAVDERHLHPGEHQHRRTGQRQGLRVPVRAEAEQVPELGAVDDQPGGHPLKGHRDGGAA
jgi:DNA-binding GntR family transcriptional regulator